MKRRHLKVIRNTLIVVLLSLVAVELALSTDPLGVSYFNDLETLAAVAVTNESGFTYAAGTHQLAHSSFTMLDNGTRRVPASNSGAAKTLVLLGDSVTFGLGVDDADTWANIVAQHFSNWNVINAGVVGYSSENVRLSMPRFPDADTFLYLLTANDADPSWEESLYHREPRRRSWISSYLEFFRFRGLPTDPPQPTRFRDDIRAISGDDRLMIVGFASPLTEYTATLTTVQVIEPYTGMLSYADSHPNAAGNRQIAEQLIPLLEERFVTDAA